MGSSWVLGIEFYVISKEFLKLFFGCSSHEQSITMVKYSNYHNYFAWTKAIIKVNNLFLIIKIKRSVSCFTEYVVYKIQYTAKCNVRVLLNIDMSMLAYTTTETKREFGSPCRNLHILLFVSAQCINAKHSQIL